MNPKITSAVLTTALLTSGALNTSCTDPKTDKTQPAEMPTATFSDLPERERQFATKLFASIDVAQFIPTDNKIEEMRQLVQQERGKSFRENLYPSGDGGKTSSSDTKNPAKNKSDITIRNFLIGTFESHLRNEDHLKKEDQGLKQELTKYLKAGASDALKNQLRQSLEQDNQTLKEGVKGNIDAIIECLPDFYAQAYQNVKARTEPSTSHSGVKAEFGYLPEGFRPDFTARVEKSYENRSAAFKG